MKTLKQAFLLILALAVLAFLIGLVLPSKFEVSRSTVVNAAPEAIYPSVASAKRWAEWSAWNPEKKKELTFTYEGPELGAGSALRLTSQKGDQGSGILTITEADPKTGVRYQVQLDNDFRIDGRIAFEASGASTKVTWTDKGEFKNPYFRYFIFVMDKVLGSAFEQGLAELKKRAEGLAPTPAPPVGSAPAAPAQPSAATPAP